MTDNTRRITKAALREFIAEVEDEEDWQDSQIPPVWQAVREFAGLPGLTQQALLERKIDQMTRLLNEEDEPEVRKVHRDYLIQLLRSLQQIEDREREEGGTSE